MSVLNQSGEEQVECPLCMEPLEVDDLNFFPCTCGYQICRFCWHRIRTDENGLCPACRKAYSENPADFTPLSKEQVAQLKAEKRQRDQQRKAKLTESRKHLASVRVVQKNLVFVVGLPMRLADPEILKRHEYFGKFGKIHKVVINQSPSYAGTQGPSASAYVTYMKSDDALRAIQSVNNITIDGRLIKSSLGTTKYCSHFMKNMPCPKPDCMYLHDFGDSEASFTKEQMHAGKHQEYEKKLHEALLSKMSASSSSSHNNPTSSEPKQTAKSKETKQEQQEKEREKEKEKEKEKKEGWPQLDKEKQEQQKKVDAKEGGKSKGKSKSKSYGSNNNLGKKGEKTGRNCERSCHSRTPEPKQEVVATDKAKEDKTLDEPTESVTSKLNSVLDDNSSFFSQNAFQKLTVKEDAEEEGGSSDSSPNTVGAVLSESLPDINSTEDWEAAFGFTKHADHLEELAKQRNNVKGTLETFGNGFTTDRAPFSKTDAFDRRVENYQPENLLELLSGKTNGPSVPPFKQQTPDDRLQYFGLKDVNGVNGISNGLKFFSEFCKNGANKDFFGSNGYVQNLEHQNYLVMQQRRQQLEEQLVSLNMKHGSYGTSHLMQNGVNSSQFLNGGFGYQKQQTQHAEDELDFDPFQETQKGLAELLENEQNHKLRGATGRGNGIPVSQMNGGTQQLPPPPPGFVQPPSSSAHMNSFGSKILPYLNMGVSNQQQPQQQRLSNVAATHNGWPSGYSGTQLQQHKGLGTCNDWKVLDPAIVTSSRHFSLATNMPLPVRDAYLNPLQQQQQQQPPQMGSSQIRSFDYTNAFSNFTQHIQPGTNLNGFTHLGAHHHHNQNLNWLGNELGTQISSPPGFRSSNQNTKQQQEC